jgi:hypothetical protein
VNPIRAIRLVPTAFLLLAACCLFTTGCNSSSSTTAKPEQAAAESAAPDAGKNASGVSQKGAEKNPAAEGHPRQVSDANDKPKPPLEPYLQGWDKPAVALLLTGEQHGYLEPCGCSETQSGGMARRADLVRVLAEEKGWELVGLDVGGTLKRSRRQDQIKFEKLFEAFKKLHYAVVGTGLEELKLGADFILTRMPGDPEDLATSTALVSANVVLFDQPELGWPLPYRLVERGGVKIGVTSIFGPSLRDKVAPAGVSTNITIREPDEVLPAVIKSLEEAKPDFTVLLSHGSEAEAMELAKKYPQFRIVLTAGGFEEPDGKPVAVGDSWVLTVGHKGKRVGVLGYYPNTPDRPFKFELVQLDKDRFKNHPDMRELMRHYQQQLQDEGIAMSEELRLRHTSGHTFIGADKCGECHTKAFAHWKETGHGVAFTTLKEGPWHEERAAEKIDWINRQFDPECLSCHVTGWHPQEMLRYDSGYIEEKRSPHLFGNQCENCHGPGSLHVAREEAGAGKEELEEGRRFVRRTVEDAKRTMCVECHDPDNSPKFTPERFDEFWELIKHPFKD